MVFDPKNRAKQFADATVYETAFFSSTVKKLEQQSQGILEQVLKENPTSGQRDAFEKAVCQEAQASFNWFDARNWKYNESKALRGSHLFNITRGLLEGKKPNCDDPVANRILVVDMLDIRFKKLGFRTPEFEELRTKYLSGKDSLSADWRYIVDGLPIDFRSDSSKSIVIGVPFILKALPVGIATGISLSLATYGIGSGAVKVKQAIEDLNRIKDPRERASAYRRLAAGSSRMALGVLVGLRAYGRIKEAPQEEPIFDPSSMSRPGRIEVVDLTKSPATPTPTLPPLPTPILWRVPTGGGQATSTPGGLSAAGGLPEREMWVNAQAAPVLTPQAPVVTPYSLTDVTSGKPLGFDSQGLLNAITQTPKIPDGSSSLLSSLLTGFLGLDEAEIKAPSAFPDDPQKLPGNSSAPINVQLPTDASKVPFLFPGIGQTEIEKDPFQQIIDIEAASSEGKVKLVRRVNEDGTISIEVVPDEKTDQPEIPMVQILPEPEPVIVIRDLPSPSSHIPDVVILSDQPAAPHRRIVRLPKPAEPVPDLVIKSEPPSIVRLTRRTTEAPAPVLEIRGVPNPPSPPRTIRRLYPEAAHLPLPTQTVYSTGKNGTGVDPNNIPKPLDQGSQDSCQTVAVLNGIQTVDQSIVPIFNPPRTLLERVRDSLTNQSPPWTDIVEEIRRAAIASRPQEQTPEMNPLAIINILTNGTFPDLRIQPAGYFPQSAEDFASGLFQEGTFAIVRHGYHVTTIVPLVNPTPESFVIEIDSLGGRIEVLSVQRFIERFNEVFRGYGSGDAIINLRRIYRNR